MNQDTPVAEIIRLKPDALQLFLEYNIDFCCGGTIGLEAACQQAGLDTSIILTKLTHLEDGSSGETFDIDADNCALDQLWRYIVKHHHTYLEKNSPIVLALLEKIAHVHGVGHPELHEVLKHFRGASGDLTMHMKKEELMLFPLISRLEVESPIPENLHEALEQRLDAMEAEHSEEGERFHKIIALTDSFAIPQDGCGTYQKAMQMLKAYWEDLTKHIHLENNILFPRTRSLLKAGETA